MMSLWGSERFGRLALDFQRDLGAGLILNFNFVTVLVAALIDQFQHCIVDLIRISERVDLESVDEASHLDAGGHHVENFEAGLRRLRCLRVHGLGLDYLPRRHLGTRRDGCEPHSSRDYERKRKSFLMRHRKKSSATSRIAGLAVSSRTSAIGAPP